MDCASDCGSGSCSCSDGDSIRPSSRLPGRGRLDWSRIRLPRCENFIVLSNPLREPVGISKLIPLKDCSIWGTGGVSSELIFRSNSADLFLNPPHLRSDQRDPGRDPGRELGRALPSLSMILGTLCNEGAFPPGRRSSDDLDRPSFPEDVKGLSFPSCLALSCGATAVAGRSLAAEGTLMLRDRPLGS